MDEQTENPKLSEVDRLKAAAREFEQRFRALVEHATDGIVQMDEEGLITDINRAAERLFGYERAAVIGKRVSMLMPEPYRREHEQGLARFRDTGKSKVLGRVLEFEGLKKNGSIFPLEINVTGALIGGRIKFTGILRDVSERKKLEEQLRQSQKMQAIGRLTDSIAHDFNNLLTEVMGYAELASTEVPADSPVRQELEEIRQASERGVTLVGQLLTFSRRQTVEPKVFSFNDLLGAMSPMLHRLIGESIDLVTVPAKHLGPVRADPGQMEQVLMHLALNARDAMPNGGKLTFETANGVLSHDYAHHYPGVRPGHYAMLAVSDTGTGMAEEVKAHLFEPFFTTKPEGKGAGMGLFTCYGIVKQAGGHINVYSELGKGTTVKVYLPRVEEEAAPLPKIEEPAALSTGSATILLAEDDAPLRVLAGRLLRAEGYDVLEASNGEEALRLARSRPKGEIHLLLTDVVMPQMGGRELAERLSPLCPGTKVLYMSGYPDAAVVQHGVLEANVWYLQKPFTRDALARRVREVLAAQLPRPSRP